MLDKKENANEEEKVSGRELYEWVQALVCSVLGLLLSFAWGTASGATIVLMLAAGYAVTLLVRSRSAQ